MSGDVRQASFEGEKIVGSELLSASGHIHVQYSKVCWGSLQKLSF